MTKKTNKQLKEEKIFEIVSNTVDDKILAQKWRVHEYGHYRLCMNNVYVEVKQDLLMIKIQRSGIRSPIARVVKTKENEKQYEALLNKIDGVFYDSGLEALNLLIGE